MDVVVVVVFVVVTVEDVGVVVVVDVGLLFVETQVLGGKQLLLLLLEVIANEMRRCLEWC